MFLEGLFVITFPDNGSSVHLNHTSNWALIKLCYFLYSFRLQVTIIKTHSLISEKMTNLPSSVFD